MRVSLVLAAAVLLTGCGASVEDGAGQDTATPTVTLMGSTSTSTSTFTPTSPAPVHPRRAALDLVGRWTVTGPGVPPGTSLYVADEMAVFLDCGVLDASWAADSSQGLFVASANSGDSVCFPAAGPPSLPWLTGARRFESDGADRLLTDADGTALARLTPGPRVKPGPNRLDVYAKVPAASPQLRARLSEPAPLPDGQAAPTSNQLQGAWIPVGAEATHASLTFALDGTYQGSDGCNGVGGGYSLGTQGRMLATTGAQTLAGCTGEPVGAWMSTVARAGLRDGQLVLYDVDGRVAGRLAR